MNDIYRGRNGRWEHLDKIATLLKTNSFNFIWANTTSPLNDPDRPAGDGLIYNAAAEWRRHRLGWLCPSGRFFDVHYAMLAGKVADAIMKELAEGKNRQKTRAIRYFKQTEK